MRRAALEVQVRGEGLLWGRGPFWGGGLVQRPSPTPPFPSLGCSPAHQSGGRKAARLEPCLAYLSGLLCR